MSDDPGTTDGVGPLPERAVAADALVENGNSWEEAASETRLDAAISSEDPRVPMLAGHESAANGSAKASLTGPVGFFHPTRAFYRWTIMICISLLSVSGYFLYDNIGSMETTIEQALDIDASQFGLLYSVYTFPNMVLPFIGGWLVDQVFGTRTGTILCLGLAFGGTAIIALAPAFPHPFWFMLAGRFLFGLGTETSYVAQNTVLCKWFGRVNNELALAMGLSVSAGRLGAFMTFNVNVMVADKLGYQAALFLGAALSGLAFVGGILYAVLDYRADRKLARMAPEVHPEPEKVNLWDVIHFGADFWVLCALTVTYYAAIFPFQSLATTLLVEKYDISEETSSRLISVLPLTSLVLSPVFGFIVDRVRLRALLSTLGILVTVPAFLVLAMTNFTPIPSIAVIGLAYSLVPAAIWPCIPLLIKENRTGTAFGLLSAFINTALTIMYWIIADLSPFNQLLLYAGLAVFGSLLGILWNILDHRHGRRVN